MKVVKLLILIGVFILPLINLFGLGILFKYRNSLFVTKLMQFSADYWFTNKNEIEFCRAIEWENTNKMKKIIDRGLDINTRGNYNANFLFYAYLKEKKRSYKWLLENGADPHILMKSDILEIDGKRTIFDLNESVLVFAAEDNDSYYLEIALKNGADPNYLWDNDGYNVHILHLGINSGSLKNVKLLIEAGANPDGIGNGTPLEHAIESQKHDMAYYLLENGANPDLKRDSIIDSIMNYRVYKEEQLEHKEKVKKLLEEKWGFDFSEENLRRIEAEKIERGKRLREERKRREKEKEEKEKNKE